MNDNIRAKSYQDLDQFIYDVLTNFLDNVSEMIDLEESEKADLEMAVRHTLQCTLLQKLKKAPFWGKVEQ